MVKRYIRALALVIAILITGCGSGGGDSSPPTCSIRGNDDGPAGAVYVEERCLSGNCFDYNVIKPIRVEPDGTIENEQVAMTAQLSGDVLNVERCQALLANTFPVPAVDREGGGPLFDFEADCVVGPRGIDVTIIDVDGECTPLEVHFDPLS